MHILNRYKRWLNQKRFVFIHIRKKGRRRRKNLTNQHNFASSSITHLQFLTILYSIYTYMPAKLFCERLFYGTFLGIFSSSSTSHYCVCTHSEWFLWFQLKTFSILHIFIIYLSDVYMRWTYSLWLIKNTLFVIFQE